MHRDDIFTSIQNLQWKSFGEEYDLGRTMGTGAYGKAMQARCKRDGEKYVVKVVDTRGMSIKSRYEVRNEVRVLSQLNHPNIVKVWARFPRRLSCYPGARLLWRLNLGSHILGHTGRLRTGPCMQYHEAFFEDGTLYIVMEMCEDGDLTAMIKERRGHLLPEDDVMRIFVQICLGLAHTHSEEVLHRDLKPSNILLSKGNIVKLADFGIARVMSGQAQLAKTVVGTPYYLSPEICEDRPYGTASDMWSLGCVLYELCALRRPFEGSSFPALIVRILSAQYDPIPSTYSRDLRKIIDALLQKRPEDRATLDEILVSAQGGERGWGGVGGRLRQTPPGEGAGLPAGIFRDCNGVSAARNPIRAWHRHCEMPGCAAQHSTTALTDCVSSPQSLEYVREHLSSYAAYIKSAVPKRYPSMRKHLEGRVGASAFEVSTVARFVAPSRHLFARA